MQILAREGHRGWGCSGAQPPYSTYLPQTDALGQQSWQLRAGLWVESLGSERHWAPEGEAENCQVEGLHSSEASCLCLCLCGERCWPATSIRGAAMIISRTWPDQAVISATGWKREGQLERVRIRKQEGIMNGRCALNWTLLFCHISIFFTAKYQSPYSQFVFLAIINVYSIISNSILKICLGWIILRSFFSIQIQKSDYPSVM